MTVIGLVIRGGIPQALDLGRRVVAWCREHQFSLVIEEQARSALGELNSELINGIPGVPSPIIAQEADLIISLGGDGTLIGVARYVRERSPVLLGVNFGTLGFLTEIAPTELFQTLEAYFSNRVEYGTRLMLHVEVIRNREVIFASEAVNDAVVQKGTKSPLISMDFWVNSENVMRLRADGLIIATPTGSTAYSLAAGGSIVFPSLGVYLVTPICPHSLTSRPLILPVDAELSVGIPYREADILLNIDGQVTLELEANDTVRVIRSKYDVRFVRSPSRSYFDILRGKLNWGRSSD